MKRLLVILATISLLTLSACKTFDPYTGDEKTSNTAKGAGIGAGIAAVVTYLKNRKESTRDRNRKILQAAGVGAIAGAGVGYYMDVQEAKLREQLRNSGVSVQREGDNINLIMPGNITFETNNTNLKSSFNSVLDSVVIVLEEFNKTIIVSSGHTDSIGSESDNQVLSETRASTVGNYLISRKVHSARVETVGFGETLPIADNASASGRELNRRVELTLIPIVEGA
ncbi:MAG: OmpA family protein [Gammaproteobacteria bacterium]|nr:OmpA family protein [Gammaproteobacteria bacterium]